jgi:capsule polysaccharide export protein KpsE/RkpR
LSSDVWAYVKPIIRWSWVTILLVIGAIAAVLYSQANVPQVYESVLKVAVSAPEPDEVNLFSSTRSTTAREEISAVQADFQNIASSTSAAKATIQQLQLPISVAEFQANVRAAIVPFSDFINISAKAANPSDAAAIATAHTDNSLKLLGEARARTITARRQFINLQLDGAAKDLASAREAMLRFQTKNGVADLAREIQAQQDSLRTLRTDRDRNMVEIERLSSAANQYNSSAQKADAAGDAAGAAAYRSSALGNQIGVDGLRAAVLRQNEMLAQREIDLTNLVALSPEYDRLRTELSRAEGSYNFLVGKLNEAQIKESDARNATFVQIIEPAQLPTRSQKASTSNMLLPAAAAALIAGIILSYMLDFIFGFSRRRKQTE